MEKQHQTEQKCENNAIFVAKIYSKTVYCFKRCLFLLFQLIGESRFLPKSFITLTMGLNFSKTHYLYLSLIPLHFSHLD